MRRWRLNSGYCGNTDQRRTKAGTIPALKHYIERDLNQFSNFLQPSDISGANLLLWYGADKESLYSNGNSVTTMTNFGSGANATSFSTGPTYTTNVQNGLPVYRFSTTSMGCRTTASYSFTDFTVLVVFKDTNVTGTYERLVDHRFDTGFWMGRNNNVASSFGGGVREGSSPFGRYVTATDNSWNILGSQRSGTTHNIWNNGAWSTRATGTVVSTATTSSVVSIATNTDNTTSIAAGLDIAEILVYNAALSDTNRQLIEGYLAHKWGLSANLPADHPYKNAAP